MLQPKSHRECLPNELTIQELERHVRRDRALSINKSHAENPIHQSAIPSQIILVSYETPSLCSSSLCPSI